MTVPNLPDDLVTRLAKSIDQASTYPCNLVLSRDFQYTLGVYQSKLNHIENKLFHSRRSLIYIWDSLDTNNHDIQHHEIKDIKKLRDVLTNTPKDPHRRFMYGYTSGRCTVESTSEVITFSSFLQSVSSRDPLLCTRQEMTHLFTHHQVMASFLDFVFTFKRREEPHLFTSFNFENCASIGRHKPQLSHVEQSHINIQHCFNILGIEPHRKEKGKWSERQVAAYHSFNLVEHRSLWIIIKGDEAMRQRIGSAMEQAKQNNYAPANTLQDSYRQTFEDQLPIFQWGTENWEHYIESLESEHKRFSDIAQYAPLEEIVDDIPRKLTADRILSFQAESPSHQETDASQPASPTEKLIRRLSSKVSTFSRGHELVGIPKPESPKQPNLKLEELVSFDRLQSLSLLNSKITQAILMLGQNKQVMADVKNYYNNIITSADFEHYVSNKAELDCCKTYTSDFIHQITRLEGELERHQGNLRNISKSLDKMETMLNGILQYRAMRTGEYFAKSSQGSTDVMQVWTQDMHEKTISMHSITICTLIFLPGTFVATIFSSGILTFGDDGTDGFGRNLGDWKVRLSGLKLYFVICVPLMLLTLCAWVSAYCVARFKRSSHQKDRIEQGAANMV